MVHTGSSGTAAPAGPPSAAHGEVPVVRTGCDLQSTLEVGAALTAFGDRYLDRVYTAGEQDAYRTGGTASLAARFAAKEAVLKVLGAPDGIDLRSIEISTAGGRPQVRLHGRAADAADAAGLGPVDVSLSHTGDLAMAVAVAAALPHTRSTQTRTRTGTEEQQS